MGSGRRTGADSHAYNRRTHLARLLTRLREPTLHRQAGPARLRAHLAATAHAVRRPRTALVVASTVAAAALQMTFEFGPLWLLAVGTATAC